MEENWRYEEEGERHYVSKAKKLGVNQIQGVESARERVRRKNASRKKLQYEDLNKRNDLVDKGVTVA